MSQFIYKSIERISAQPSIFIGYTLIIRGSRVMNFFEHELRKLFDHDTVLMNVKYLGSVCLGELGEKNRFKAEFITCGTADKYEGIKVTILNKNEGVIDSLKFRFEDLFGKKQVNNPNFREGITPHIWRYRNETEWYVYKPNAADYKKISNSVSDYLDLFREPTQCKNMYNYQQQLADDLIEEACRQWCDFIADAPELSDGKGFANFHREIYTQKYNEYAVIVAEEMGIDMQELPIATDELSHLMDFPNM